MIDRIGQVNARGVLAVLAELGTEQRRGNTWSPCPSCGSDRRSRSDPRGPLGVRRDGAGVRCHACQWSGDALKVISTVLGTDVRGALEWAGERGLCERDEKRLRRATSSELHAATPKTSQPATFSGAGPKLQAATLNRSQPATHSPRRPPDAAAFWNSLASVLDDEDASAWLQSRGVDAGDVELHGLARVIPRLQRATTEEVAACNFSLPRWAWGPGGSWTDSGHRLVVPMYGASGVLETVHARALMDVKPKTLSPGGFEVAGSVMANELARRMLAGDGEAIELVRRVGVWIAEGLPDFLVLGTHWSDADESAPAVLSIISGSVRGDAPGPLARVPDGCAVTIATDPDLAGDDYAATIVAALGGRCPVRRWRPREVA